MTVVVNAFAPCVPGFGVNEEEWQVIEEARDDPYEENGHIVTKVFQILQGVEMKIYHVNRLWDKRRGLLTFVTTTPLVVHFLSSQLQPLTFFRRLSN